MRTITLTTKIQMTKPQQKILTIQSTGTNHDQDQDSNDENEFYYTKRDFQKKTVMTKMMTTTFSHMVKLLDAETEAAHVTPIPKQDIDYCPKTSITIPSCDLQGQEFIFI